MRTEEIGNSFEDSVDYVLEFFYHTLEIGSIEELDMQLRQKAMIQHRKDIDSIRNQCKKGG